MLLMRYSTPFMRCKCMLLIRCSVGSMTGTLSQVVSLVHCVR